MLNRGLITIILNGKLFMHYILIQNPQPIFQNIQHSKMPVYNQQADILGCKIF